MFLLFGKKKMINALPDMIVNSSEGFDYTSEVLRNMIILSVHFGYRPKRTKNPPRLPYKRLPIREDESQFQSN
jgi:hypothetical protein